MVQLFDNIHRKGVVLSFGLVLSRRAPPQMYLFGAAKGHTGPMAISKIMKWVVLLIVHCLWERGVVIQFVVVNGIALFGGHFFGGWGGSRKFRVYSLHK